MFSGSPCNSGYQIIIWSFNNSFFQDNSEIHFKVKMTTHLKKLKESYSQRQVSHHEHIFVLDQGF